MTEPSRVAFKLGSSKRPIVKSTNNRFDSSTNDNDQREFGTDFHNGELKCTTAKPVKQELIIPMQPNAHNRFFKTKTNINKNVSSDPTKTTTTTTLNETVDQLDAEVRRAIILEAQQANQVWNERTENESTRVYTIEQDSTNTFMNNMETDDNQIIEEKEVENADYDQIPIEDFGMAVLRGMGYTEGSGIGITNKKKTDVFEPEIRPRGLGLGADRKVLEKINQLKRNLKQAGIDEKDDLCYEKGAFVLIQKGLHTDLYGTIESIEEDLARLTVSLAIGGTNKKKEIISISQYNVKLVTEKEFLKYSKYVNKSKAEKVEKETSDTLMKNYHRRKDDDDHHHHRSSDRDRKHHRSSKEDRYESSRKR